MRRRIVKSRLQVFNFRHQFLELVLLLRLTLQSKDEGHPVGTQVLQLTLSLRRLSDKLCLTDEALLTRTAFHRRSISSKNSRQRVLMSWQLIVREKELEWTVKAAEEVVKK
jgi:hypothetical protein